MTRTHVLVEAVLGCLVLLLALALLLLLVPMSSNTVQGAPAAVESETYTDTEAVLDVLYTVRGTNLREEVIGLFHTLREHGFTCREAVGLTRRYVAYVQASYLYL